jgi:hypothetical protein
VHNDSTPDCNQAVYLRVSANRRYRPKSIVDMAKATVESPRNVMGTDLSQTRIFSRKLRASKEVVQRKLRSSKEAVVEAGSALVSNEKAVAGVLFFALAVVVAIEYEPHRDYLARHARRKQDCPQRELRRRGPIVWELREWRVQTLATAEPCGSSQPNACLHTRVQ